MSQVDLTLSQIFKEDNYLCYYDRGAKLGSGAFGIVYEITEKTTGNKYAVKEMKNQGFYLKQNVESQELFKEAKLLKQLDHPNLIKQIDVYLHENKLQLILEKCDCDLRSYMGRLNEQIQKDQTLLGADRQKYKLTRIKSIFKNILDAMLYLLSKNISHRDLKPENILMIGDTVKLSDFGLAKQATAEGTFQNTQLKGTESYMAPEMITQLKKKDSKITCNLSKSDVWSAGITLLELVTTQNLQSKEENKELGKIKEFKQQSEIDNFIEARLRRVQIEQKDLAATLIMMLQKDYQKRGTWKALQVCSWISEVETIDRALECPTEDSWIYFIDQQLNSFKLLLGDDPQKQQIKRQLLGSEKRFQKIIEILENLKRKEKPKESHDLDYKMLDNQLIFFQKQLFFELDAEELIFNDPVLCKIVANCLYLCNLKSYAALTDIQLCSDYAYRFGSMQPREILRNIFQLKEKQNDFDKFRSEIQI